MNGKSRHCWVFAPPSLRKTGFIDSLENPVTPCINRPFYRISGFLTGYLQLFDQNIVISPPLTGFLQLLQTRNEDSRSRYSLARIHHAGADRQFMPLFPTLSIGYLCHRSLPCRSAIYATIPHAANRPSMLRSLRCRSAIYATVPRAAGRHLCYRSPPCRSAIAAIEAVRIRSNTRADASASATLCISKIHAPA
ncbi:hypothetical protein PAE9249_03853 [Paenibacillus sp. CECT 9249]|nr:hypothetical protein PAE9249_03853 [Paenibacillus sp. CECT 9249]